MYGDKAVLREQGVQQGYEVGIERRLPERFVAGQPVACGDLPGLFEKSLSIDNGGVKERIGLTLEQVDQTQQEGQGADPQEETAVAFQKAKHARSPFLFLVGAGGAVLYAAEHRAN